MLNNKFNLYDAGWLDIVFANRNKNYGAYDLRLNYSAYMLRAIAITVSTVLVVTLFISYVNRHDSNIVVADREIKVDLSKVIQLPPAEKIKKVMPAKSVQQSHAKTVVIPTIVKPDVLETVEPPKQTDITNVIVGAKADEGDGKPVQQIPSAPVGGNGGDANKQPTADNSVHDYADVAPEPNGGMAGWAKFLQRNLHYINTDAQGRVILSFVVERDGSLTDIKLVRSVDPELDKEAMRVLKIAPKWKPGIQSGKAVRVQYNIPINFQLQ